VSTKNISVVNVLLILNPKPSSYWEENSLCPSQNKDNYKHFQGGGGGEGGGEMFSLFSQRLSK